MDTATMTEARKALRDYFGYSAFHPGQEDLIRAVLQGKDTLGVMPTGAGKSICYQIPALLIPGLTVVVSPLISLMKDQVDGLRKMGIPAALLNSSLSAQETDETLRALEYDAVKLLYVAPERLESEGFVSLLAGMEVSMVTVDEAHCVSQWGHDFRPSYGRIRTLIDAFAARPRVNAFTATATERVKQDILLLLGLQDPYLVTTGFDRPALYFAVQAPVDRDRFVLSYLEENKEASGIVYCLTRKQVEALSALLAAKGISALPYHAGLPDSVRSRNQEAFRDDSARVMVATNAFGMGIDKSNVRFVMHYGMPKTLENYYQEAGRAGRDGEKADCILLYSSQDIMTNRFLIEHSGDGADKSEEYRKLQAMIDYCNGDDCLRFYILRYFGEKDAPNHCESCLNCSGELQRTDITVQAQKILSCVVRMGNRYGSVLVSRVLRGARSERLEQLGFLELSTYGVMRGESEKTIKELIAYLTAAGYLENHGEEYPVLAVSKKGMTFLRERQTLWMGRALQTASQKKPRKLSGHGPLFESLRGLRSALASEQGVAPYVIFSDASLIDMCARLPQDRDAFALVSGVGRFKLTQYGDAFLSAIRAYTEEHGQTPPPTPIATANEEQELANTVRESYALYQEGLPLAEIAQRRRVSKETIAGHLIKAYRAGEAVCPDDFIPEEQRDAILDAIAATGDQLLRPIKECLPEQVSYTAIRFAIEMLRHEKGKEASL